VTVAFLSRQIVAFLLTGGHCGGDQLREANLLQVALTI